MECHADAECINTIGTYKCRCRVGFEDSVNRILTGVTGVSDEIREGEWLEREDLDVGERPVDRFSTGIDCVDINECVTKTHGCHFNAKCLNTHGTYECQCQTGYQDDIPAGVNPANYFVGTDCIALGANCILTSHHCKNLTGDTLVKTSMSV